MTTKRKSASPEQEVVSCRTRDDNFKRVKTLSEQQKLDQLVTETTCVQSVDLTPDQINSIVKIIEIELKSQNAISILQSIYGLFCKSDTQLEYGKIYPKTDILNKLSVYYYDQKRIRNTTWNWHDLEQGKCQKVSKVSGSGMYFIQADRVLSKKTYVVDFSSKKKQVKSRAQQPQAQQVWYMCVIK